jgi:transglycosylase-like protein with SLT domain
MSHADRASDRGPLAPPTHRPRKGTRLLNSIASITTAALAALVAALMLVGPATPRSLAAVTSTTTGASPIASLIVSAVDETFGERAVTVSRSLGAGRGSTSAAQNIAAPAATAEPAAPAPAPTPTVDDARSYAIAQIGAAQFSCLDALWQHESDWDPSAENPSSGAYGIAQALPAAKMASVGHDWTSNPLTQVKWGLEYIAGRYGTACSAWSFWLRHYPHWY